MHAILSQPCKLKPNFNPDEVAQSNKNKKLLRKYFTPSEPNWGPKARATGDKKWVREESKRDLISQVKSSGGPQERAIELARLKLNAWDELCLSRRTFSSAKSLSS